MISLEGELETSERKFNTSVGSADTKDILFFVLPLLQSPFALINSNCLSLSVC